VRQSLGKFNIAPPLDFEQENSFDLPWDHLQKPIVEPKIQVNPNFNPFHSSSSSSSTSSGISPAIKNASFGNAFSTEDWKNFYEIKEETIENEQLSISSPNRQECSIQQFIQHQNQLLFPFDNGLMCLHYKRAKERIAYEEMLSTFVSRPLHSQQMIFPIELDVKKSQVDLWNENSLLLNQLGFTWDKENSDTISITGVPEYLEQDQVLNCVQAILEKIELQILDKGEFAHEFIASIAFNSSQKNKTFQLDGVQDLIEKLFNITDNQYTPNGKRIYQIHSFQQLIAEI
jgi:DNA mismatch repair protein MutL